MGQLASGAFDGSGTGVFPGGAGERRVTAVYNFATHGGAEGSIVIGHLPVGSTIIGGHMTVDTALVGVGASVGITAEGAGDVVAVAAISGAPWSTTGKKAIIPKANTEEATSITATEERDILFVISGAALTAGKVTVSLRVLGAA